MPLVAESKSRYDKRTHSRQLSGHDVKVKSPRTDANLQVAPLQSLGHENGQLLRAFVQLCALNTTAEIMATRRPPTHPQQTVEFARRSTDHNDDGIKVHS